MEIRAVEQKRHFLKMDALVIGVFEGDLREVHSGILSGPEKSRVLRMLSERSFHASKDEGIHCPIGAGGCDSVFVVGLKKKESALPETLRKAAARIVAKSKFEKWSRIRLDYDTFCLKDHPSYSAQALVEGFLLSGYEFRTYKSEKKENGAMTLQEVELSFKRSPHRNALLKAVSEARILSDCVNLARDFGNEPPNILYPESFANRLKTLAAREKIHCEIYDDKKLHRLGMGGILAVGQGSVRKPRLVILEHRPRNPRSKPPIVFVGKGITFDSGGISIKPSKDMEQMKFDMCGAAAVAATLVGCARLGLPLKVVGLMPLAENLPGGGAQRPGDIITCYNGKKVDVLNTDAEGRLILADALAFAATYKPRAVVDIATLTGLCASFFDHVASGLMGTNPDLVGRLKAAGEKTGERLWELPLWEDYEEMIKGSFGDIQNISRHSAGTITAAMFLKHFANHSPWAHLDIAGTAWVTTPHSYQPVGATGVGVRLFLEYLKSSL